MLSEVFGDSIGLLGDYFEVVSRHFVVDYRTGDNINDENNSDFCIKAAQEAIQNTQIPKKEIGLIITCTNTPDYSLPQTSTLIQEKVGLKDVIPLDLRGGCSSPLQGVLIAESFIKNGLVENAMVVGGECFSTIYYKTLLKEKANYLVKDLMNGLIFGDGAAAVIISKNKTGNNAFAIERTVSQSSFSDWPSGLLIPLGGSKVKQLGVANISLGKLIRHVPKEIEPRLSKVTEIVFKKVHAENGYTLRDFKYVVGPQANKHLINSLNKRFKVMNSFYCGDITGNVPGAALLLAFDKLFRGYELKKGEKILMLGAESSKWIYGYSILNKV